MEKKSKKIRQIIAAILVGTLLFTMLVSCRSDFDGENDLSASTERASGSPLNMHLQDTSEWMYRMEILPLPELPDGMFILNNLHMIGDDFYLDAYIRTTHDLGGGHEVGVGYSSILTYNINNKELTLLPNFTPTAPPQSAFMSGPTINAMQPDDTGNLWILETGDIGIYDFPDGVNIADLDPDTIYDFWKVRGNHRAVRKLDNTGKELLSFDLDMITPGQIWFTSFNVDSENNVYIDYDNKLLILDQNGSLQFELSTQGTLYGRLIRMPDGKVVYTGQAEGVGRSATIREIDLENKTWGPGIPLPQNAVLAFRGNDEFPVLFSDEFNLYAYNPETEEGLYVLNWGDINIKPDSEGKMEFTFLEDGNIIIINNKSLYGNLVGDYETFLLKQIPYEEPPDRIVLTLAAYMLNVNMSTEISDAVAAFNRENEMYYIEVTDYSGYDVGNDQAGLTRFILELTAGNIPGILSTWWLPLREYAAKGLLEDLYPFLDADTEISRSDLIEGVLSANEIDGSLYTLFPYFTIYTLVGNPAIVGSYPGWTMSEFKEVLHANPQADMPLGMLSSSRMDFFWTIFNSSDYIDWEFASVNFNSESFIQLLQYAASLPEGEIDSFGWQEEERLIVEGRQIISFYGVGYIDSFRFMRTSFGGEIVFKGFPAENKNGSNLSTFGPVAMTAQSKNKEGVWEFIRFFLTEDFQRENIGYNLPLNKVVLNELLDDAMKEDDTPYQIEQNGVLINVPVLTQSEVDLILALFDNLSNYYDWVEGIEGIISEGVLDYFNGRVSVEDAVRVIQNRASILMSERVG